MIRLLDGGAFLVNGSTIIQEGPEAADRLFRETGRTPAASDAKIIEENQRLRVAIDDYRRRLLTAQRRLAELEKGTSAPPAPESGEFYVIQRGDSLSRIAQKFKVSVEEVRRINQLTPDAVLQIGNRLRIPGR